MIPYPLHVTLLLALFYTIYRLLLQRETFFHLHRWVLLGGIFLAFLLPLIQVPANWSLKQQGLMVQQTKPTITPEKSITTITVTPLSDSEELRVSDTPKDLILHTPPLLDDQTIAPKIDKATYYTVGSLFKIGKQRFWSLVFITYGVGVLIFLINFLIQLFILTHKIFSLPKIKDGSYYLVELPGDEAPHSFWNFIFINAAKYEWEVYSRILAHEKVHALQMHSLDIILAELLVICQWFNPVAWWYRKAVVHNLEFLTDQTVLEKGEDKAQYQWSLLQVTVPQYALSLTSNYNQSILKKRIAMMNTKKSSLHSSWKYLTLLAIIIFSVISLNAVKPDEVSITQMIIDEIGHHQVEALTASVLSKSEKQIEVPTSLEGNNESSEQQKTVNQFVDNKQTSDKNELKRSFLSPNQTEGRWVADMENGKVCINFRGKSKHRYHHWSMEECLQPSAFEPALTKALNTFKLVREAGTFTFTGEFNGKSGSGEYSFSENADFKSYLTQQGYSDLEPQLFVHLALANINRDYLDFMRTNKISPDTDELEALAVHRITKDDLQNSMLAFKAIGYNKIEVEDFIEMHIHNVSPDYVQSLKDAGVKDLDWEDIVAARIHNVSPDYIKMMHDEGFADMEMDELVQFAIHDVDAEYIKTFKSMGFRKFDTDEIIAAKIHNVTPEYVKSLQAAGLGDMDMDELTGFAIHGVDAEYITTFKSMGFRDFDADDIMAAKIHNVTPEYVKSLQAAGLGDMDMDELTGFAIHGVDAEYIKTFKSMGFRDFDADDIVAAKIHNVTPEYVKSLQAAGLGDMDMDELTGFAIHGVDAEYIKTFRDIGFRDFDNEDIIGAKIHGVTPEYIKSLQASGLGDMDMETITSFRIHGVQPAYIAEFKNAGLKDFDDDDIIAAKIHGLDVSFVKEIIALGFNNADMDELVSLKIHDVSASFIKKEMETGFKSDDLEDYIDRKIRRNRDQ